MIKEYTGEEDFESIKKISVRISSDLDLKTLVLTEPDDKRELVIEDKDEIYGLLNSDLRVYKGGRIKRLEDQRFIMTLHFENWTQHDYTIGKNFILPGHTGKSDSSYFKVLDDKNTLYNYFKALYDDK